ncbi:type VI secretion system Vgr family protein [Duganella qianjiadongensis]|uniref:Type VI secretion system tip protein VgrG n=1 Tax=Duganella qianjiadongensis TaxID=2692176 RepID=A0ABW9VNW7_9BURK|nr:type VI secretion system Vgr family protein [Duganella qianjiadongensis]MYM41256.1 type VI secretion system tip protein VgrG [Duganella qianjiadongensis]
MNLDSALTSLYDAFTRLTSAQRPLRLRLAMADGVHDNLLLPQRLVGHEAIFDGHTFHLLCIADTAMLALKDFIGVPAEIQIVTATGELRSICGIVASAASGESDGALATYELTITDALQIMEHRLNTRVFRNMNELDIISTLVNEWQQKMSVMRSSFALQIDSVLASRDHPAREFTFQHNESDAGFIRRLMKRRGIAWFFQSGQGNAELPAHRRSTDTPMHTLLLFDASMRLPRNEAGSVAFQRDLATMESDAITGWSAVRTLQSAQVQNFSWDYLQPAARDAMRSTAASTRDQGELGSRLADELLSHLVLAPHSGDDKADLDSQTTARLDSHDYAAKHFRGEGTARDLAVGTWIELCGHAELDSHAANQREFVITAQDIAADNNLPKEMNERIVRLFADSGWSTGRYHVFQQHGRPLRFLTRFQCVRRGTPIIAPYDSRTDIPQPRLQSALVVGPELHKVWCDEYGRVKIRFPATREEDHHHAGGIGANEAESDSAWVRVVSNWAGDGAGNLAQCGALHLPRVGSEVLVDFLGGDPDKPVIIGQLFNGAAPPPAFSRTGALPGNAALSGLRSRELGGTRGNQLRLDDTEGQISAQLACDHGASELNLGYLTTPRINGSAEPRGEGAELRSDQAVALRGVQGVYLVAGSRADLQLERQALKAVTDDAENVRKELDRLATVHELAHAQSTSVAELVSKIEHWDGASNLAQNATGATDAGTMAGAPLIAAHGDAGVVISSADTVLIGTQKNFETSSIGDHQASAGRSLFLRATQAVQLFAAKLGMRLIAGAGNIQIEAHEGEIVIKSLKRIHLISNECVRLEAPTLQFISQGAKTSYVDGQIADECKANYTVKCAEYVQLGAGDSSSETLKLPHNDDEHDQQVQLRDLQTKAALPNQRYRITVEDGKVYEGKSDANGLTERFSTKEAFAHYDIELLD